MEPPDIVGEHPKDTSHVEGNVTRVSAKNCFHYSGCLTFVSPHIGMSAGEWKST